jgi:hypothetical protein
LHYWIYIFGAHLITTRFKMKKTLLSIFVLSTAVYGLSAQTYSPSAADGIPGGSLSESYSQDIAVSIPASVDIDLSLIPGLPTIPSIPGLPSLVSMSVTATSLTVEGLPLGLSAACSPTCTVSGGSSTTITVSGSPTQSGAFAVEVTSSTTGIADMSGLVSTLQLAATAAALLDPALAAQLTDIIAQIPENFPVPAIPGIMDEGTYNMFITDPNGIKEANETFSLGIYPNPTVGISTLDVNSTVAGNAIIEVYSITGSLVQTSVKTIRIGANRLNLNLTAVPAGIYMVKADINGSQALVRMQKK